MRGLVRSLLFVPGNRPRMLEKGPQSGADALILDLEDSVPVAEKETARQLVRSTLERATRARPLLYVRVNALSTGLTRLDLEAVLHPKVHAVCLPKCERGDVRELDELLTMLERERGLPPGGMGIEAAVETAKGVLEAREIAESSPRVRSVSLGGEDFATHMGVSRTGEGTELLFARSWLALCARAAEVQAVDAVYADFSDEAGLRREARLARQLGFSAKHVIHPQQVGPVNEVFSPGEQEVAEARRIVSAFEESLARGEASVAVDGKMVDIPVYKRAKALLETIEGA